MPMANMSYCRFQNTLADLKDCYDHFETPVEPENDDDFDVDCDYLSSAEGKARDALLELCRSIVTDYGSDEEEEEEEGEFLDLPVNPLT